MHVAILAGGSGTRLWPLSRSRRPKQLLSLITDRSLIQDTVDRIEPLVSPEQIFIVTEQSHAEDVRVQLPAVPSRNFVIEPVRRGTAPALALAALVIQRVAPDTVMASLHSDAVITNPEELVRALRLAEGVAASSDYVVTLGVRPTSPATNLGYVEMAEPLQGLGDGPVHRAARFVEKPDAERARQYLESGHYFWNSGIFVWRVSVIMDLFQQLMPGLYRHLMDIKPYLGTPDEHSVVAEVYPRMEKETIDYGIMEKAPKVAVVPTDLNWSDVGSWRELMEVCSPNEGTNLVRGTHLGMDTERTLVFAADRPVVTIGLRDLVIVDAGDVLLVSTREKAQEVKKIVEQLESDESLRHLC
ncbi:MAG: mannose-1-phosphate guanylyltransferase [Sphingomonadaceae bacterium]